MSRYIKEPSYSEAEEGYCDMVLFEEIRMAIQNDVADIFFWKRLSELLEQSAV